MESKPTKDLIVLSMYKVKTKTAAKQSSRGCFTCCKHITEVYSGISFFAAILTIAGSLNFLHEALLWWTLPLNDSSTPRKARLICAPPDTPQGLGRSYSFLEFRTFEHWTIKT
jgi:hypothetical protein